MGAFLNNDYHERTKRELTKPSGTPKDGTREGWVGKYSWYWREHLEAQERLAERKRNREHLQSTP